MSRVHTTLRQTVRDWSSRGASERQACYGLVIDRMLRLFSMNADITSPSISDPRHELLIPANAESARALPSISMPIASNSYVPSWYDAWQRAFRVADRSDITVLNPGSGLSRLTWELARLGFRSIGNEFSYYMLLVAYLVLNQTSGVEQHTLFPWIMQTQNVLIDEHRCRSVQIPDVDTTQLPSTMGGFSMLAGDFIDIFPADQQEPHHHHPPTDASDDECCHDHHHHDDDFDRFSAICTVFFIDCANNIIEFVRTISRRLEPGGFWMNCGPLLYHFSDMPHELSVELTLQEVLELLPCFGLRLLELRLDHRCEYLTDPSSMMHRYYSSCFFVCQKVVPPMIQQHFPRVPALDGEPAELQYMHDWELRSPEEISAFIQAQRPILMNWARKLLRDSGTLQLLD